MFAVSRFNAFPSDGVDDLVGIQAAIEAAATATPKGMVVLEAGQYDLNPDNIPDPTRVSEGHPSCLTIWSNANGIAIVGAGSKATILRMTKTRTGPTTVNILGSGGSASIVPSDGYTFGVTNIALQGFTLDAAGYAAECTQIYFASNWFISDVFVSGSPNGCDGWDFQGGNTIFMDECGAMDCTENALGTQDVNFVTHGFQALRCGITGGTGSAFQFNAQPYPVMYDTVAKDCNIILAPGSGCHFVNAFLHSTNTAGTNITVNAGATAVFVNSTLVSSNGTTAPQIWVNGGTLLLDKVSMNNNKQCILMTSGILRIENGSRIGSGDAQENILGTGGTVTLLNSYLNGGTSKRDIKLETGTFTDTLVAGNYFLGGQGIYYASGGNNFRLQKNVFTSTAAGDSANISTGGGTGARIEDNYFVSQFILSGGTITFSGNTFAGTYRHDGGTPAFINANTFLSAANQAEMQENFPTTGSITATATQTLWTNTQPYNVEVVCFGGAIEGVGKNGLQVASTSTLGRTVELGFGEWVGITNSSTASEVIRWHQKR